MAIRDRPRGTPVGQYRRSTVELFCRIAAPQTAVTETATVTREMETTGAAKAAFAVLVQAHPRGKIVEIDQAGLLRMRIGG